MHRRPQEELNDLQGILQAMAVDGGSQEELKAMGKSMAEVLVEQGIERGREEGRLDALRGMVLRIGRKHLGEPPAAQQLRLKGITEFATLEALSEAAIDANSWDELLP